VIVFKSMEFAWRSGANIFPDYALSSAISRVVQSRNIWLFLRV